jgi:hypothetical protein
MVDLVVFRFFLLRGQIRKSGAWHSAAGVEELSTFFVFFFSFLLIGPFISYILWIS